MQKEFNIKIFQPNWNVYSWSLIILCSLLQLAKWQLLPMFIDIYYHLSVMLGFNQAGGYVTNAFWEYAPIGRPHLYPPLLHILMLILYKIGLSKLFIARFFSFIMYPTLIVAVWFFARGIFNKRFAFFCVLLTASSYYFYLEASNIIASSLALILGLLAILSAHNKRNIAAVMFLSLTFYAHSLMGWIIVLAFILYCLFSREIGRYIRIIIISFILYLPFFLYQIANRNFFKMVDLKAMHYIEIGILIYIFSILGLIVCFKKKKEYYLLIALTIGFLLFTFNYRQRFFSGHGLTGLIFLAACGLEAFYLWFQERFVKLGRFFVIIAFVAFYLIYPTVNFDKHLQFSSLNSAFINIIPSIRPYQRANEYSIYAPKFINPIADIIIGSSKNDEIFYSDLSYAAGMLSVFSGRAISCAMLPEISPYKSFDPIKESTLIVWFKDANGIFPERLKNIIFEYGLRLIAQTPIAYIYRNPFATAKLSIPKPLIPTPVLFSILFICIMLALWDIFCSKEKT